jgi:RimJ/RimL family protein N-acetyltransferase
MLGIPILETARLVLRPFQASDLDAYHEIAERSFSNGPDGYSANSLEKAKEALRWIELNEVYPRLRWWNSRMIARKSDQTAVGEIAFVPMPLPLDAVISGSEADFDSIPQTMELSMIYGILPEHRGNGYAGEAARAMIDFAFRQFNLRRVMADTEHANAASQAVMRKAGMTLYRSKLAGNDWLEIIGVINNPAAK